MKRVNCLLVLFLVCSCEAAPLSEAEYVRWIDDAGNRLIVKKEIGAFAFAAQYKPTEYIAARGLKDGNKDSEMIQRELRRMEGFQYFTLRIGSADGVTPMLKTGLSGREDYNERVRYFSFDMQDDLFLIDGADTLRCVLFHFERNYNVAPFNNFLLAFEDRDGGRRHDGDKTLVYEDAILGVGPVKLTVKRADLGRIPILDIH